LGARTGPVRKSNRASNFGSKRLGRAGPIKLRPEKMTRTSARLETPNPRGEDETDPASRDRVTAQRYVCASR